MPKQKKGGVLSKTSAVFEMPQPGRQIAGPDSLAGRASPAVEKALEVAGSKIKAGRAKFKAKRMAKKKQKAAKTVTVKRGFKKIEIRRLTPATEKASTVDELGLQKLRPL